MPPNLFGGTTVVIDRHAVIVVGLGAGDESKGSTVDYLARTLPDVHTVVRYNGGPQAAHNVVTADGTHHCFAQFGSAAFVPGIKTYLTGDMIVSPPALLNEAAHLADLGMTDALARLVIADHAPIITPIIAR